MEEANAKESLTQTDIYDRPRTAFEAFPLFLPLVSLFSMAGKRLFNVEQDSEKKNRVSLGGEVGAPQPTIVFQA